MDNINIYSDGGSRNNPGHAAIGVVINDHEFKKYIGIKTNNEAEYEAVLLALIELPKLFSISKLKESNINFFLDSELVCNQLNGTYKVKDLKLQSLFLKIWNIRQTLPKITFKHILRDKNKRADRLVNEALDEYLKIS